MSYHEQLQLFFKSQGDSHVIAGEKMGYSKSYFSHFMNGREVNMEFIRKLINAYPSVDLNKIFKGPEVYTGVNEPGLIYTSEALALIDEMEEKLSQLKQTMSQK